MVVEGLIQQQQQQQQQLLLFLLLLLLILTGKQYEDDPMASITNDRMSFSHTPVGANVLMTRVGEGRGPV